MTKVLALIVFLSATVAGAGDFTVQPITITVPPGFEGPIQQQREGMTVVGFTKSAGSTIKAVLQISIYDLDSKLANLSDDERAAASSRYLLEFVGGVGRRRTNFRKTEPAALEIAGVPAAKLEWTGQLQGTDTVGVMYCFLVGSRLISFHTQDLGTAPTDAMKEAIEAYEAARVHLEGDVTP